MVSRGWFNFEWYNIGCCIFFEMTKTQIVKWIYGRVTRKCH